ncbi:MAG TPA: hypothetical protein VIZ28_07400 [Chitinophagaceae bacterium]
MKKWILLAVSGLVLASCAKGKNDIAETGPRLTCTGHIKTGETFTEATDEQGNYNEENPGAITIALNSNKRIIRD